MIIDGKDGKYSERRVVNRSVAIAYIMLAVLLIGAYTVEVIKGSRTWQYLMSFSLLFLIPGIINALAQWKNPETKLTKYILPIAYLFICGFVLCTGVTYGVYVYVIPMLIGFTLFHDWKYTSFYGTVIVIMNIIYVAMGMNKAGTVDAEIQIAAVTMVCIYSGLTCYIDSLLTKKKMAVINEASENNEKMLARLQDVSKKVVKNTQDLQDKIEGLYKSIQTSTSAMTEVCAGTSQTAESIQDELIQIDNMGNGIDEIEKSLNNFTDSLRDTMSNIKTGAANVEELQTAAKDTSDTAKNTVAAMASLAKQIDAVKQVMGLIEEISEQTNLLSLNASIEAARAGEAGRGFAVVAEEIRNLSEQTKSSLEKIAQEIAGITDGSARVTKDMEKLSEIFGRQEKIVSDTSKIFADIDKSSGIMVNDYKEMARNIGDVKNSKTAVIDNIGMVSAATEEVTANAQNTMVGNEENIKLLDEVTEEVGELSQLAKSLIE